LGHWRLGFKQSGLRLAMRVLRDHRLHVFDDAPASAACSCPVGLSPSGKPLTRRSSTSEPPSSEMRIFWSVKQRTSFGERPWVRSARSRVRLARSWGRVGGWRGTSYAGVRKPLRVTGCVLSHPPPSEPRLQLSPHTALQCPEVSGGSALAISATLFPTVPVHLSRFALWPAFPTSDYYRDSVAMGLAPVRRS
jgi:hypothetical protein